MIKRFTSDCLWPEEDLQLYCNRLERSGYEILKINKVASSFLGLFGNDSWDIEVKYIGEDL